MGISQDVMIFSSLVSFDICERRFSGGDVLVERLLAISRRVLALRSFENYAKSGATTRFLKDESITSPKLPPKSDKLEIQINFRLQPLGIHQKSHISTHKAAGPGNTKTAIIFSFYK